MPEVQFSFHFTNLAEEVGIVVLLCVVRQMRRGYFNGVFCAVKFQYFFCCLCFEERIHITLIFFLFRCKPDMLPKLPMICNENVQKIFTCAINAVPEITWLSADTKEGSFGVTAYRAAVTVVFSCCTFVCV